MGRRVGAYCMVVDSFSSDLICWGDCYLDTRYHITRRASRQSRPDMAPHGLPILANPIQRAGQVEHTRVELENECAI